MCKGQNVNALWVQDTQVVYSVDPVDGSVIYYPLLREQENTPKSFQMVEMICVSNGNSIIGVVYESDGSQAGNFLLLVYMTDPVNSRSRVLHSVITLPGGYMQPPIIVAHQLIDLMYITVHMEKEESAHRANEAKYIGTYIVYLEGPLIHIPKTSLEGINDVTLEISNWKGKTNFEFELNRFQDDKVKIWK